MHLKRELFTGEFLVEKIPPNFGNHIKYDSPVIAFTDQPEC